MAHGHRANKAITEASTPAGPAPPPGYPAGLSNDTTQTPTPMQTPETIQPANNTATPLAIVRTSAFTTARMFPAILDSFDPHRWENGNGSSIRFRLGSGGESAGGFNGLFPIDSRDDRNRRYRPSMRITWCPIPLLALLALSVPAATAPEFARGADVSWLSQMEAAKVVFKDGAGKTGDLLDILKGLGFNSVRLRVWVKPATAWCDSAGMARTAKRAAAKGMRVMVDFHYSDSWVDPGVQTKPVAWASHGIDQLKTDVAAHTTNTLKMLRDSGVVPEWVQIGNETNNGMLWEEGKATSSMANFAALVQSGSKAAKAVFPQTKVIIHLSNGFDNVMYRWMFDGMKSNNVDWDVIGMSLYPDTTTWRATEAQCKTNMQDMVSRYGKQVVISEVGMHWRAADSTYALLKKLIPDVQNLSNSSGIGVFYWEPEAYEYWGGYQKSAFDSTGKPTHALDAFKEAAPPSAVGHRAPSPSKTLSVHDILGRRQESSTGSEPLRVLPAGIGSRTRPDDSPQMDQRLE